MSTQEFGKAISLTVEEKLLQKHRMSCDEGIEYAEDEEDLLGAESLLLSDSEEDDGVHNGTAKSPKKKISPKSLKYVIEDAIENAEMQSVDSEAGKEIESYTLQPSNEHFSEPTLNASPASSKQKKTKKSTIIDSESENDETQIIEQSKALTAGDISKHLNLDDSVNNNETNAPCNNSNSDDEDIVKDISKKKKVSALIDSDNEDIVKETSKKKRISALIDSDSEDEQQNIPQDITSPIKRNTFANSESENDGNISESVANNKGKHKHKAKSKSKVKKGKLEKEKKETKGKNHKFQVPTAIDDESSITQSDFIETEEHQEDHNSAGSNDEETNTKEEKMKQKHIRASAQKALNEMQVIQSEQQRLHREAHVSVPYHKPKKYTLKEFLSRRTIIKPQQMQSNGSPAATVVQSKSLKMTAEELEEYAKLMEERAKEATEFFKSESESEPEEFKDNDDVLDAVITNQKQHEEIANVAKDVNFVANETKGVGEIKLNAKEEENLGAGAIVPNEIIEEKKNLNSHSLELNYTPLEMEQISDLSEMTIVQNAKKSLTPKKNNIVITEIVELPAIDLNTLHINQDTPSTSTAIPPTFRPTMTSATTPRIKTTTESLKKLIAAKHLTESPTIAGDTNMLIDLETGDLVAKKPSGVDNLLERLIATNKHKNPKSTETVDILSTENGKLEMCKVQIHHLDAETDLNKEHKPGAAYFKLKENLKAIIHKKRKEDMLRKQEQEREHDKCFDDDYDEEEDYEEYEPDTKVKPNKNENEDQLDDEEIDFHINEEEEIFEAESDNENIDNNGNSDDNEEIRNDNSDEIDDGDKCEDDNNEDKENSENNMDEDEEYGNDTDDDDKNLDVDASNENPKRKNRIIQAFQDDSDDDIDLLKTPAMPLYSAKTAELFNITPKRNLDDEQNELLELCSGKFNETQATNTPLISQIPITQFSNVQDNAEELLELCSGTFDGNADVEAISGAAPTQTQQLTVIGDVQNATSKSTKILSSDEEDVTKEQSQSQRTKKLTKRMKKNKGKAKLGFSDDEADESADNEESDFDDEANEDDACNEEIPETFIDYDSEENEIVVEMTKKDRVMKAQNFVENEAELSESDWGSADEDEKNLDRYDFELGDEEEFDREKLQTELGQIHARKMLDEDIREVRKIQEMLFEDEEQDGVGRQRQFRWKNAENGFSLDDTKREGDVDATQNDDSADEESEHLWRKIRFEREQLLKEQRLKKDSSLIDATHNKLFSHSMSSTVSPVGPVKKINIITVKKSATSTATTSSLITKKNSPFLISKCASTMHEKTVRGSFLERDKEILEKLAGLTKGRPTNGGGESLDSAATVSVKEVKAKNFVFATLTEEEHENLKRKADDLMNSSSETGINYMKKPRMEPRREKCFIDQLL